MRHRAATKGNGGGASPAKTTSLGKGSGRPQGKKGPKASSSAAAASSSTGSAVDLKDIPLALPVLAAPDHVHWVPRYHAVIRRSDTDGITLEDTDTLQLELEAMLASAVLRKATLKEEIKVLSTAEKYRGSGKNLERKGPSSPVKRGVTNSSSTSTTSAKTVRDSAKRFKSACGKPLEPSKVIGLPKIKSDQPIPHFDPLENEQIRPIAEQAKPMLPKNETPNRFWAFVEPYCAQISADDIKLLEDLLKTHNDMSEYFRIPPLGQHYTQRWAKEDLENERMKSTGESGGADRSSDEGGKMLKKAENAASDSVTPYGELTQRLVGGLMEENVMTSIEESIEASSSHKKGGGGGGSDGSSSSDNHKSNLIKSLNINHPDALEARVRKELEDQGIIRANDDEDDEDNDEILEEMKRCQSELRAVSSHNLQQLRRLLHAAKEEMVRQEMRNRLQKADQEVMDAYQKISAARSKKKAPSKKERDQAWKTLKEREIILKEMESV